MSFALSSSPLLFWKALFWRPQIVWTVIPPTLGMPNSLVAAKLAGAKSWLHVQDLEVDAAFNLGLLTSRGLQYWALRLEGMLLRRFDIVSSITPSMLAKLAAKGVASSRSVLFPNWVDTDYVYPLPRQSILRAEFGLEPGDFVALYSGNLGEKQGLGVLVDVARRLSNTRAYIVICGAGAGAQRLRAAAQDVSNILFLPLQPFERLNELLNLADVHLLPQRRRAGDLVMPSKLGGMLASGRPVVTGAAPGTELARAVEGAGIVIEPENADAMVQAVLALLEAPERRAALGTRARERALEDWSRATILARFNVSLVDNLG
jgi:colanic acid biosynthesis glycosyl transferase WcaI